jgi:hypothetical protein
MTGLLDAVKQTAPTPQNGVNRVNGGTTPPPTATAPDDEGGDAFARLAQIEKNVEGMVPDQSRKAYLAVVVAGRQLMFSEQTHSEMEQWGQSIQGPQDVPPKTAHGVIKTLSIVMNEVQQKQGKAPPVEVAEAAAYTLMTHALKYVDGQLGIPVTNEIIDQTAILLGKGLLALFGQDEQKIQGAFQQAAQQAPQPGGEAPEGEPTGKPEAETPETPEGGTPEMPADDSEVDEDEEE